MKIAILIARIVLGLMFLVFGLNGLLHFMPNPPMPPSDAVTMLTILGTHKYLTVIGILMIIGGVLILVGRYTVSRWVWWRRCSGFSSSSSIVRRSTASLPPIRFLRRNYRGYCYLAALTFLAAATSFFCSVFVIARMRCSFGVCLLSTRAWAICKTSRHSSSRSAVQRSAATQ